MGNSIYLVNPATDCTVYFDAGVYHSLGLKPAAFIADLSITTVAALVPKDFDVVLCDESITPADLDTPADYVGLTGKSTQKERLLTLAQAFRKRGKTVIVGGPLATLSPETVRPHCDILVRGELEHTGEELFRDLRDGTWKNEYRGDRPDLGSPVVPRWDLYPNDRALQGCLQTSRGCPFACEFCDVGPYVGRRQRVKPASSVLLEAEALYEAGYRTVFLADDNFLATRKVYKDLLRAIGGWNSNLPGEKMNFATQLSADVSRDKEALRLCYEAGMKEVFVGFETVNLPSLEETKKKPNISVDLVQGAQSFVEAGIGVIGGMIVGFDADGPEIFDRQYEFAMSTPVPVFSLAPLVAPPSTPLFERLSKEGRIRGKDHDGGARTPWETNIVPLRMNRQQLLAGLRDLAARLYHPKAFGQRLEAFASRLGDPGGVSARRAGRLRRRVDLESAMVVRNIPRLGREEAEMYEKAMEMARNRPAARRLIFANLFRYMQIRAQYEAGSFWQGKQEKMP